MAPQTTPFSKTQNLIGHLEDLKKTLIRSFIFIGIGTLICLSQTDLILSLLKQPLTPFLKDTSGELIFTAPVDKFLIHMKTAVFSGLVLASPFWLYEIWRFISPGLYVHEKKMALVFTFSGVFLFLLGMAFCYFIVYPKAFSFLFQFGGDQEKAFITIKDYMSFLMTTLLVFGLAFETPLILIFLGRMKIVSKKMLQKNRRYAFLFMAVLSALITPPDVLSMIFLLIPLFCLYELSVFFMPS